MLLSIYCLTGYGIPVSPILVRVYDRFDGDTYKCRLEIFQGGKGIKDRAMKYEGKLDEQFVLEAERRLAGIIKIN